MMDGLAVLLSLAAREIVFVVVVSSRCSYFPFSQIFFNILASVAGFFLQYFSTVKATWRVS